LVVRGSSWWSSVWTVNIHLSPQSLEWTAETDSVLICVCWRKQEFELRLNQQFILPVSSCKCRICSSWAGSVGCKSGQFSLSSLPWGCTGECYYCSKYSQLRHYKID
jgi:hypothetical protein